MRNFFRLLTNDIKRIFSPLYAIGVLIIIVTMFISSSNIDSYNKTLTDIFISGVVSNYFHVLFPVFAVIPGLLTYWQDVKTGSIYLNLIRVNKNSYIISKVLVNFFSAFTIIVISHFVFVWLNSHSIPLTSENSVFYFEYYKVRGFDEFLYLITFSRAFSSAFFSVMCLVIANFSTNVFVISSAPYLFHRILNSVSYILGFPVEYSFVTLMNGSGFLDNYNDNMTFISIYFIALSLILAFVFYFQTKRKELWL